MGNIYFWIINIVLGIITAIIHKRKGFSIIPGFLWGFLFSILGLLVVLLEKNKEEHDAAKANGEKSIGFWLAIFVGIGSILIIFSIFVLHNF